MEYTSWNAYNMEKLIESNFEIKCKKAFTKQSGKAQLTSKGPCHPFQEWLAATPTFHSHYHVKLLAQHYRFWLRSEEMQAKPLKFTGIPVSQLKLLEDLQKGYPYTAEIPSSKPHNYVNLLTQFKDTWSSTPLNSTKMAVQYEHSWKPTM